MQQILNQQIFFLWIIAHPFPDVSVQEIYSEALARVPVPDETTLSFVISREDASPLIKNQEQALVDALQTNSGLHKQHVFLLPDIIAGQGSTTEIKDLADKKGFFFTPNNVQVSICGAYAESAVREAASIMLNTLGVNSVTIDLAVSLPLSVEETKEKPFVDKRYPLSNMAGFNDRYVVMRKISELELS